MAYEGVGSGGGRVLTNAPRTNQSPSLKLGRGSLGSIVNSPARTSSASLNVAPNLSGTSGTTSPVGGGGGGFGSIAAPPAIAAPPPPPAPMTDVDWFNADAIYRGEAGRDLADLTSQLAQIMADRDSGYQQLGNTRDDLGRSRHMDLTGAANDAASRGILSSGLFAQQADRVASDFARQGSQLDQVQSQLQQQYGNQGTQVDLSQLASGANNGMGNLNSIYGLLGALGLDAGNRYQSSIGQAKAQSAGRAAAPLIRTLQ